MADPSQLPAISEPLDLAAAAHVDLVRLSLRTVVAPRRARARVRVRCALLNGDVPQPEPSSRLRPTVLEVVGGVGLRLSWGRSAPKRRRRVGDVARVAGAHPLPMPTPAAPRFRNLPQTWRPPRRSPPAPRGTTPAALVRCWQGSARMHSLTTANVDAELERVELRDAERLPLHDDDGQPPHR